MFLKLYVYIFSSKVDSNVLLRFFLAILKGQSIIHIHKIIANEFSQ